MSWKEPDETVPKDNCDPRDEDCEFETIPGKYYAGVYPLIVQGGRGYGDIILPVSFQVKQIGGFVCDKEESGEIGMYVNSNSKIYICTQNDNNRKDAFWLAIGF